MSTAKNIGWPFILNYIYTKNQLKNGHTHHINQYSIISSLRGVFLGCINEANASCYAYQKHPSKLLMMEYMTNDMIDYFYIDYFWEYVLKKELLTFGKLTKLIILFLSENVFILFFSIQKS